MGKNHVKIIMGSGADFEYCKKIGGALERFDIPYEYRVGSAHKTPGHALDMLSEDDGEMNLVYITVAGRSNALSGFCDANTHRPVIACPPYSDRFGGADIFSSLRSPSGVGAATVLEPEAAAIAVAKMFALSDEELAKKIKAYQEGAKQKILAADKELRGYGKG